MRQIIWIMICLGTIQIFAAEWQVDKSQENLVKFTSEVVVLSFDGITDKIDGYIYWEGAQPFGKNHEMYFEVDLNALDTDNGKRDRDMRNVLETDKWRMTTFKGAITRSEKIDSSVTAYRVTATGDIFIHGVQREIAVPGTVVMDEGEMHVTAGFNVKLSDFNIEAPSLAAFVKVSEEIQLTLDFYLKKVND